MKMPDDDQVESKNKSRPTATASKAPEVGHATENLRKSQGKASSEPTEIGAKRDFLFQ